MSDRPLTATGRRLLDEPYDLVFDDNPDPWAQEGPGLNDEKLKAAILAIEQEALDAARATPVDGLREAQEAAATWATRGDHERAWAVLHRGVDAALAADNPTRREPVTLADSEDYGDDASDWFAADNPTRDGSK